MTTNLSKEQTEAIQREVYKNKFRKPGFPEYIRKITSSLNTRLGAQLQIQVTGDDSYYKETYKIRKRAGVAEFDISIKSYTKSECCCLRVIRNPSSRKDYNNYKAKLLETIKSRTIDQDEVRIKENFLNNIEKLMTSDFNFFCESLCSQEFYFALESDSLFMNLEMYIKI